MALSTSILNQIHDETGPANTDFTDVALEEIYTDPDRGNFSVLATALIVWRRRLHDLQSRSFDVTTGGNLLSRSQRVRFIERRIKELEYAADDTVRGRNQPIQTPAEVAATLAAAEFD